MPESLISKAVLGAAAAALLSRVLLTPHIRKALSDFCIYNSAADRAMF